jgi:hypothetical protein
MKAMVEALDIRNDPERDEKYIYKDRDEIEYSPDQYILNSLDIYDEEKQSLIACLVKCGTTSRSFNTISPSARDQRTGHHGFPLHYGTFTDLARNYQMRIQ